MITMAQMLWQSRDAMGDHGDFTAWGRTRFGRSVLIQVGDDPTVLPDAWRLPAVVLLPTTLESGDTADESAYTITAELRLRTKEARGAGGEDVPVLEYEGVYLLDEFAQAALVALRWGFDGAGLSLDRWTQTWLIVPEHPVLLCRLAYTIKVPTLIGGALALRATR